MEANAMTLIIITEQSTLLVCSGNTTTVDFQAPAKAQPDI